MEGQAGLHGEGESSATTVPSAWAKQESAPAVQLHGSRALDLSLSVSLSVRWSQHFLELMWEYNRQGVHAACRLWHISPPHTSALCWTSKRELRLAFCCRLFWVARSLAFLHLEKRGLLSSANKSGNKEQWALSPLHELGIHPDGLDHQGWASSGELPKGTSTWRY